MSERIFLRVDGGSLLPPEMGSPEHTMGERRATGLLAAHVSSVLCYREAFAPGQEVQERVLPDGAMRLVFQRKGGTGFPGWNATVVGATATPTLIRLSGEMQGFSIALRPGSAGALLGVQAFEMEGRAAPLGDLWPEAPALLERLEGLEQTNAQLRQIEAALLHRSPRDKATASPPANEAVRLTLLHGGRASVREVSLALGMGERRLQQLLRTHTGLTHGSWRRIARMHACLKALRGHAGEPARGLAELAVEAGFYDQAHLANEIKSLCGLSPRDFATRISHSSKTI